MVVRGEHRTTIVFSLIGIASEGQVGCCKCPASLFPGCIVRQGQAIWVFQMRPKLSEKFCSVANHRGGYPNS